MQSLPATARLCTIVVFVVLALGCEQYDAPPRATLIGARDGIMPDPAAPLLIQFHEPVVRESLRLKVVDYVLGSEGELAAGAQVFFDSADEAGGEGLLNNSRDAYSINLLNTLPIGPQLAVVIEPGLQDDAGNTWNIPQIIKFGFEFDCDSGGAATNFPSAASFMVVEVDEPIETQLTLWANIVVNPEDGSFVGQFTDADRDMSLDCSPFGLSCEAGIQACRTLPTPDCVAPSERASNPDAYPDYSFSDGPPEGFSVEVSGCVRDEEDGTWTFSNAPVDVQVTVPKVGVKGINFNAQFRLDEQGVLRGSGTFTAAEIFLGTTPSGSGAGSVNMREVPADEVPQGLPHP